MNEFTIGLSFCKYLLGFTIKNGGSFKQCNIYCLFLQFTYYNYLRIPASAPYTYVEQPPHEISST